MIKEALLDISKGYVKVFFDGNPVDSIYSVDDITDDESGMKKIQLPILQRGITMKHQKEWHTCDRCGKEIKVGILCTNSITRNGILNTTYDLCNECMEDFGGL